MGDERWRLSEFFGGSVVLWPSSSARTMLLNADAWTMVGDDEDDSRHGSTTPLPATSTTTTTAAMATADEDSASTAVAIATMMIAPEIPRWRFIAKAKKTEGYSSHAAGTIVDGKAVAPIIICLDKVLHNLAIGLSPPSVIPSHPSQGYPTR